MIALECGYGLDLDNVKIVKVIHSEDKIALTSRYKRDIIIVICNNIFFLDVVIIFSKIFANYFKKSCKLCNRKFNNSA